MPSFRHILPWRRMKRAERPVSASTQLSVDSQMSVTRPTPQTPIRLPAAAQPPETVTSTITANQDISETLWSQAYKKLEERELELLECYQKHLGDQLKGPDASLSNPATIATLVQQLQEDRQGKQWKVSFRGKEHRIRDQVEKLAKLFVFFDAVIKQAASAQPYTALAWSGVSVFLPLLSGAFIKDEAMVKGFTTISDIQLYWRTCEETFLASSSAEHYQDLIAPLSAVYSHVLEYQIRAVCHLASKQSSRAWQKVAGWGEWTDKASSIVKASEECKAYFEPLQQREARRIFETQLERLDKLCETERDILQAMKEYRREDKHIELLQALASAAPTYEADKNINPKQVKGTCCGKSVLSRALIDGGHLRNDVSTICIPSLDPIIEKPTTVCYFFFKEGDSRRTRIANALCATLHQLFSSDTTRELIQHGISAYDSNGKVLLAKVTDLWKILTDCAESWPADIICVLDALDECDSSDYKTLSHLFTEYYPDNPSPGKLKSFITSRPYDIIESVFRPMSNHAQYVRFDGDERYEDVSRDIDLVIDSRINDVASDFKPEDKRKIAQHLKSRGTKTYLWLHLTLSIIEEKPSCYRRRVDIEALLSEIPAQVSEAYEKILQRSEDERVTITLLQILLTAKRDLTVAEANYALTMALAETPFHTHADLASQCWQGDFKTTVKNFCGLIVNVYDNRLSFIHLTAREFLISKREADIKWQWKGRFQLTPELDQTLTQCCLTYLLLDDWLTGAPEEIDPDSSTSMAAFPFLSYAVDTWSDHFNALVDTVSDSIKQQARRLLDEKSPYKRVWVTQQVLDVRRSTEWEHLFPWINHPEWENHSSWRPFSDIPLRVGLTGWTNLAVASLLGLYTVVEDMLATENVDVNAWVSRIGTALNAAIESGKVKLVALLISRGADVNLTVGRYSSALVTAIGLRNEQVVNLLLLHGADARRRDPETGRFPVELAVFICHEGIFRAVLGKIVDLDTAKGIEAAVLDREAFGLDFFGYLAALLDVLGPDMHLTQHMLEMLMSEYDRTDCVTSRALNMALDRPNGDFKIKAGMLKSAINSTGNIELLRRLLRRKDEFQLLVTDEVIQIVAKFGDTEKMKLFLEHFDMADGISCDILLRAASNTEEPGAMLQLLLDCRKGTIEDGDDISSKVIANGNANTVEGLSNHPELHFHVSRCEFLNLIEVARRRIREGIGRVDRKAWEDRMAWEEESKTIVERIRLEVLEDDCVLGEAAEHATSNLMGLVLNRLGEGYVPSENVLCRAAKAEYDTLDKVKMLMEWQGKDMTLTPDLLMAAGRRPKVLEWLLETRGQNVDVTEKLIEVVVGLERKGWRVGESMEILLRLKRDDVARLAPFALLRAARYCNIEVLELLANDGLITPDMFTEEVLLEMLAHRRFDFDSIMYFKRKLLEQTTISAELMERMAMHNCDAMDLLDFVKSERPECFYITEGMIKAAATNGLEEVLHMLSRWRAEEAAAGGQGCTAVPIEAKWFIAAQLRHAATMGDVVSMQRALDRGADPNAPNLDGVTPIVASASSAIYPSSLTRTVKFLASIPAVDVDVNAADKNGTTALHHAATLWEPEAAHSLLIAGADPDKADSEGVTPYMLAMERQERWPRIAGLFRISSNWMVD